MLEGKAATSTSSNSLGGGESVCNSVRKRDQNGKLLHSNRRHMAVDRKVSAVGLMAGNGGRQKGL